MSTPTSWNDVPDPGGPGANREGPGYEVRKGYVHAGRGFGAGPSVLAVGDVFTADDGTTYTVQSFSLVAPTYPGQPSDSVTFVGGTTVTIAALLDPASYAPGGWVRSYVRTYAASPLSVWGTQAPH